jgi:hypothetical protein
MDRGRVRFGLTMVGSYVHASHDVMPGQEEPGLPGARQPAEHVLDIGLLQWDVDAQIGAHRRFAFEILFPIRATFIDATFLDANGAVLDVESIHHRDETISGIGDLVIGGRIGLVLPEDVRRWTLALRTGLSFPTGAIEPDPYALGSQGRKHQHMFFGSGTFDPVIGFDTNLDFDRWGLVGWMVSKIPPYENRYGYRGSTVVVGGVGAMFGFGLERWRFLVQPEVYSETSARWSGTPDRNSGRTSLIAGTGVFVMPAPGWQIHLLAKFPYYTWARGGQLQWPFVGMLGFSWTIDAFDPDA